MLICAGIGFVALYVLMCVPSSGSCFPAVVCSIYHYISVVPIKLVNISDSTFFCS